MSDDDKEFRYTSYPSGLPKTYREEDEKNIEAAGSGKIKKLLVRTPWQIKAVFILLVVVGSTWMAWSIRN